MTEKELQQLRKDDPVAYCAVTMAAMGALIALGVLLILPLLILPLFL